MSIVQINGLSKSYRVGGSTIHALKRVDMEIEQGTFVSVIGPSGSGKSTLLNIIGCLDQPDQGSVRIAGQNVANLTGAAKANFRGQNLGFVFQNFNLIPVLTVLENVEYPLLVVKNMSARAHRKRVLKLLGDVGVLDQKDNLPSQISGGQMQRVAVARALVTQPKLVIADEPTANLDHDTAFKIIRLMKQMKDKCDTTYIFSTHDPKIIGEAEVIYTLEDGKIVDRKDRRQDVQNS